MAKTKDSLAPAPAEHRATRGTVGCSEDSGLPTRNQAAHEALLDELRCAMLRAKLATNDLAQVGTAVRSGLITVPQAVALLDGRSAFDWLVEEIVS